MPNSKLPIQRANRICEPNTSAALTTRMRKAEPATFCAIELWLTSARHACARREQARETPARRTSRCFGTDQRHYTPRTARRSGDRPARRRPSKEALTFGWAKVALSLWQGFQFGQNSLDRLAFVDCQGGLRRNRIADRVALGLQTGLDAGRKVEAGECLVDPPQLALKFHRLGPAAGTAQVKKPHALARDDAGWPRHPADPADQHHRGGNVGGGGEHAHLRRAVHDREQPSRCWSRRP